MYNLEDTKNYKIAQLKTFLASNNISFQSFGVPFFFLAKFDFVQPNFEKVQLRYVVSVISHLDLLVPVFLDPLIRA